MKITESKGVKIHCNRKRNISQHYASLRWPTSATYKYISKHTNIFHNTRIYFKIHKYISKHTNIFPNTQIYFQNTYIFEFKKHRNKCRNKWSKHRNKCRNKCSKHRNKCRKSDKLTNIHALQMPQISRRKVSFVRLSSFYSWSQCHSHVLLKLWFLYGNWI